MPETLNHYSPSRPAAERNLNARLTFSGLQSPVLMLAICLSLFVVLVRLTETPHYLLVDIMTFRVLDRWQSPAFTLLAKVITFLGTGSFLIPAYVLMVVYSIRRHRPFHSRMVIACALSSLLLGWLLKPVFHRVRPLHPLVQGAGGSSFPSGHALGAFTFSLLLLFLIRKSGKPVWIKRIASIIVAFFGSAVALTRVYLHVHYATDIAGSFLVAVMCALLMYIIVFIIYRPDSQLL